MSQIIKKKEKKSGLQHLAVISDVKPHAELKNEVKNKVEKFSRYASGNCYYCI